MTKKLLLVGFGCLVAVLLLVFLEGALALLGIGEEALYEDPFVGFARGSDLFVLQKEPGREPRFVTHPSKLAFFNEQSFPATKAPGTVRVFALGGSTTAGRPYDHRVAFPRWLELYLTAASPDRRFEVINAGAISYASYRVVLLMRELLRYEPDWFVVYTGHNEFLEERTYSDLIHEKEWLLSTRMWLSRYRFAGLVRRAVRRDEAPPQTLPAEVTTRLDGWRGLELYHRDADLSRAVVEHFRHNLRQMVAMSRHHGVGLIFILPVSNLKDFSPFKSEHGEGLALNVQKEVEGTLLEGRKLLSGGSTEEAVQAFRQALTADPEYAESHFRLGQALLAAGRFEDARLSFVNAKDLDVAPLRALEVITGHIAAVAGDEGVPLVDLPAALEKVSREKTGHGILGNELLLDHVHPDIPVHSLIAQRLVEVLAEQGVLEPGAQWGQETVARIYDGELQTLNRRYYAERDLNLAKVLGWAGKLEEAEEPLLRAVGILDDHPEVHLNLGIIYQRTGRPAESEHELRRALELEPDLPEAQFNLGVTMGRLGRLEEAVEALRRATQLRGDYEEALYDLGILTRSLGNLEEAAATLEEARSLRPEAPEIHRQLGLVYRDQGRFEEAETCFRRSLELDPEDPESRVDLAIVWGEEGRLDEALGELQAVLGIHPDHAEALFNLGVLLAAQGSRGEAAEAYGKAVAADPGHARALNNLGILLASEGRLDEARSLLERAIRSDPSYADAFFNLGVVLDQSRQPVKGLAAIGRALELDPENRGYQEAYRLLSAALAGVSG